MARLTVRVTPNASRDEVKAVTPERVEVRLRAPAVEGRANEALIVYLADRLGLKPREVAIERGHTARLKVVAVAGLTEDEVRARLLAGLP